MKRRTFIKSIPILAVSPFVLPDVEPEGTLSPPHLIALGTAASKFLHRYKHQLQYSSITMIDEFLTEDLKGNTCFIPFDRSLYRYDLWEDVCKLGSLPLEASIRCHFESLTGDLVFVSGLGRTSGSLLSQSLGTQYIHPHGNQKWVVTLPFQFEGIGKFERAYSVLRSLMNFHEGVTFLDFDEIRERFGNLSIRSAFEKGDQWILNELRIE